MPPHLAVVAVIVIASDYFFMNYFSTGARASTSGKFLDLIAGERGQVTCLGKTLSFTRTNRNTGRVDCTGVITPTRAPAGVSPTAVAGGNPTAMPSGMVMPTGDPNRPADWSFAMGLWDPATNANYMPDGPQKYPVCTRAFHDTYNVVGPDGKRYPAWHPPVAVDPATGKTCSFGHEHGRDPTKYAYYDTLRRHFAYDANKNGTIESSELATAGVPFNYVNEQIDVSAPGYMRHEDHVGNKIEYVNAEADTDQEDRFSNETTGGFVIPRDPTEEERRLKPDTKWYASGVRCYFFDKFHQGVNSQDAFSNNIHELLFHSKCTSTRSDYQANEQILTGMIAFGIPGQFTRFPTEQEEKEGVQRTDPVLYVKAVSDANNSKFPSDPDATRIIPNRSLIETTVLLPPPETNNNRFSGFPYEIWAGQLEIRKPDGTKITGMGGSWEVLGSIRYFYPGKPNNMGYLADVCYEVIGNRRTRGGTCDDMTNYGKILGITWKDTRSGFKGIHRGQYMEVPREINNAGGSQYYYTDAFGKNASTAPFKGSVRQMISTVNTRVNFASQPRIIQRYHDEGEGTVHAPN